MLSLLWRLPMSSMSAGLACAAARLTITRMEFGFAWGTTIPLVGLLIALSIWLAGTSAFIILKGQ
jgi:hypothetical protein